MGRTSVRFEKRGLEWDLSQLMVPAEIPVYTAGEREALKEEKGRFIRLLEKETVWSYIRPFLNMNQSAKQ